MKKILINITNGFSLRYLCHSEILKTFLENKNIKVYLLSNNSEATKKNLNIEKITYLQYDEKKIKDYQISSKIYNFLEILRLYVHGGNFSTPSVMFNYLRIEKKKKFFFKLLIFFCKKIYLIRKLLIFVQSKYYPKNLYSMIEELKPDLIVTSSLGVFRYDDYVLRIAKVLGIKSFSCILSWDNSTTRGYPGALPSYIFSWTKIMTRELVQFSDCNKKKIFEGGIAHFDNYYNNKIAKFDIKKKFNISKNKKIIFFATKGPSTFQYNPNITDLICKNIKNQNIKNAHLITRIHPLFYKVDNNKIEFQNALNVFKLLNEKYECLTVDFPNITSLHQNFEMDKDEQEYLKDLIIKSDVIVNIYSTLNIEGSILNKPLINIDFDNFEPMYEWNKKFERQSLSIDRSLDHNKRIMSYDGISNVNNEKELVDKINIYIDNPKYLFEERKKIFVNEAGPHMGSSGKYIANKIISFL